MTIALLGLTVALLPLLAPSGPGNSAPVDAAAALFLVSALVALAFRGRSIRTPAAAVLAAIAVTTLVATAASSAPRVSVINFAVEAYLILLFWGAASVLDGDRRGTRTVMTVWAIAAVGWAALVLGAHYQLLPTGLGELLAASNTSGRVAGAAKNPNLAASYLVTSFFVLLSTPRIPRVARLAAAAALVWAVVVTGSNGALLGLGAGLVVVAIGVAVRRFAPTSRAVVLSGAAGTVLMVAAGVLVVSGPPSFSTAEVTQVAASQDGGSLDKSLGRLDNSVGARIGIWSKAWSGSSQSILVGIGPNASNSVSTIGKGLHNDYLAFLLERGIGGALALLALVILLLHWSASLLVSRVPDRRKWALAGLAGGIVANLVMAFTHESFHFRHLWLLLALAWVCRRLAEPHAPRSELMEQSSSSPRPEPLHALS